MDFSLTSEQALIQQSVERFVSESYGAPQREAIAANDDGFSREHWRTFAELGWLSLLASEEDGGFGGGALETMIVMELFGAGLVSSPFVTSVVMAGVMLSQTSGSTGTRLRREAASGSRILGLAYAETDGGYEPANVMTLARRTSDGFVVDGCKIAVPYGAALDTMLVSARTADRRGERAGITMLAIDAQAPGITRRDYVTYDERRASDVTFDGVAVPSAAIVGEADDGLPLLEAALDRGNAAICAEAVGAMGALLRETVEYLKTRKQFERPIGSFQALQHRAVDMLVQLELARAITTRAAAAITSGDVIDSRRAVAAAKVHVASSARIVGETAIQLHGAIGITDELVIGHYVKRLTMIEREYGDGAAALARFQGTPARTASRRPQGAVTAQ